MNDPPSGTPRLRAPLSVLGAVCAVLALILVVANRDGTTLAGALFALEGAAAFTVALGLVEVRPLPAAARIPAVGPPPGPRLVGWSLGLPLAAVTAVALAIRLVGIDGDFWLDEVVTYRDYASRSFEAILTGYDAPNNHLLNSLLAHVAFLVFGYAEWATRLPALIAGVATVPALCWVARPVLGDRRAIAASALLAVAGPHVLFSANARGYTLSLLFGLLATGAFVRGLRDDRLGWWASYVACAVLTVAAVPTGGFVVGGHAVVGGAAVVSVVRRGGASRPLAIRLVGVFALVAALTIQVYAPVLGRIPGAAQDAWREAGAGAHVLSGGFLRELVDSATGGAGPALVILAVPCAIVGLLGLRALLRRDWPLMLGLVLGPLLHAAFVALRGLAFSPRFLLFLTFAILLVAVESIALAARWLGSHAGSRGDAARRALEVGGLALAALVLAAPFLRVAGLPNQPYREALDRTAALRPGALVVGVYPADSGVRFYGVDHPRASLDPTRVATARTLRGFDELVATAGPNGVVVLSSQPSVLREARPALYRRLERDYPEASLLGARIGDGAIAIRLPRAPS